MGVLASLGVVIVLMIAVMAILRVTKKGSTCPVCPACPPGPNSVSFWSLPDGAGVPTEISCGTGTISVQNADYGAPWSGGETPCQWADVTAQARTLMDGKTSYTIPANPNLLALLGVTDPCVNVLKTFGGAYTCE